jgi:hypothetical protein
MAAEVLEYYVLICPTLHKFLNYKLYPFCNHKSCALHKNSYFFVNKSKKKKQEEKKTMKMKVKVHISQETV